MAKESFSFYRDWKNSLKSLPNEQKLELYNAIVDYGLDGIESAASPIVKMAMTFIKGQIDRNNQRHQQRVEQLRVSGSMGGRPRKNQKVLEKPNGFQENQKNQMVFEKPYNNKENINNNTKENKDKANNTLDANASLSSCDDAEVAEVDTGEYISYKDEKVDIARFITFWNNRVEGSQVPKIVCIKGQRRTMLEARLKQFGKRALFEAVDKLGHSDFLRGMTTDNGWHATFDWLVGPRNFVKVLEGNYDNKTVSYGNDKSNQKTVREREQEKRLDGYAEVIQKLLDESDRECVDIDEVREG